MDSFSEYLLVLLAITEGERLMYFISPSMGVPFIFAPFIIADSRTNVYLVALCVVILQ